MKPNDKNRLISAAGIDSCAKIAVAVEPVHCNDRLLAAAAIRDCTASDGDLRWTDTKCAHKGNC